MKSSYITKCLSTLTPDLGYDSYTDEELVILVQTGYASAKIVLCHRYVPLITKYSHVSQLQSIQGELEATLWECFLQAIWSYESTCTQNEDESDPLSDFPSTNSTEEEALAHLQRTELVEALSQIDPIYANILIDILYHGKQISQLAKEYGISRQGMHKKYKKAISLIQEYLS